MANFERKVFPYGDDNSEIHLTLDREHQSPLDYDLTRDMGEVYSVYELIILGRGDLQKGIDKVHKAMEEARNPKNSMRQVMDTERNLQDELDVLIYKGDIGIVH